MRAYAASPGESRLQGGHALERGESLPVAAELDERVTEDSAGLGARRIQADGPLREAARLREAVTGGRPRGEAGKREVVVVPKRDRAPKRLFRPGVVGRVGRLSRTLLIGEAEQREPLRVAGIRLHAGQQPLHERSRVSRGEALDEAAGGLAELTERVGLGGGLAGEHPAERCRCGCHEGGSAREEQSWSRHPRRQSLGGLRGPRPPGPSPSSRSYGPPTVEWWTCS